MQFSHSFFVKPFLVFTLFIYLFVYLFIYFSKQRSIALWNQIPTQQANGYLPGFHIARKTFKQHVHRHSQMHTHTPHSTHTHTPTSLRDKYWCLKGLSSRQMILSSPRRLSPVWPEIGERVETVPSEPTMTRNYIFIHLR